MAETAGKLAIVKVSGTAIDLAAETLTRITDTTWQVTTAAKQVLARDVTPVLEYNDGGGYDEITYESVDKLSGIFTFAGAGYSAGSDIRVKTGNYLPMSSAAYAHAYTYRRGVDLHDASVFLATHKNRIAGLKFASGTLSQWDMTDTYFSDTLTAGDPVVLEFRDAAASEPLRVWALLESQEMRAAIESTQDEIVTFISTDVLLNL